MKSTEEGLQNATVLVAVATPVLGAYNAVLSYLAFMTISLPTMIYWLLSASFTVHLNFTSLSLIAIGTLFSVYTLIRYRYLNKYSKLPLEPQRKEAPVDVFPEDSQENSKPGLHNYLDEFLSAIKVFGYLDRPVFHELTRHMQTRKLTAGDTINLEEEKSFCLVVDGHVQVFFKSHNTHDQTEDEQEDGNQGYRLLTDVRNGAPLSSMFSILSLFTEDVKLRHDSVSTALPEYSVPISARTSPAPDSPHGLGMYSAGNSRRGSGIHLQDLPHIPLLNEPRPKRSHSVHPGIIARANVDTTIAVIPAEAFRRLTRIYPKASAHIVQVILTRFQRVTFATGHNYLGLAEEILRTEKSMNDFTSYDLPNYVQATSLTKLKQRLASSELTLTEKEKECGVVVSSPVKRRPTLGTRPISLAKRAARRNMDQSGHKASTPGDLLSSTDPHRSKSPPHNITSNPAPVRNNLAKDVDDFDEDSAFRDSVLHCMFKSLGLEYSSAVTPRTGVDSVEASPRLVSYDSTKQKTALSNNAFGYISAFDLAHTDGGESESAFTSNSTDGIETEMDNDLEIIHFPKGAVLVEQGERNPGLYYVIDGFLDVGIAETDTTRASPIPGRPTHPTNEKVNPFEEDFGVLKLEDQNFHSLFLVKPGGIAGYQASIGNYRSFVDVRAKSDVLVGFLPRASLERIVERKPVVLLTMAKRLISLLSPMILHLDFALEWLQVGAGQIIYRQNDESDAIYIVLNGRVRSLERSDTKEGEMKVTGEYGNGESVGELEVLTDLRRPSSLHAVRDTELARFPKQLFQSLAMEHPGITIQISKLMAKRMANLLMKQDTAVRDQDNLTGTANLRTVCILPVTAGVPVMDFANRLSTALLQVGTRVHILNQESILSHLGRYAFSRMGKLKLAGHLADLEEKYGKILYVADTPVNSPWTQSCISQADIILLIAPSANDPAIGEYERFLVNIKTTARKELILLHNEKFVTPGSTRAWLKNRPWVNVHHHIQMPTLVIQTSNLRARPPAQRTITTIKNKIQTVQSELYKYTNKRIRQPMYVTGQQKNDFARLARRLCGKTVGLVLGGGGARGLAHIGVIKALEEAGIPIDMVGGTSIGAFVGGLYAREGDLVPMYGRAKKFSGRMSGIWRFVLDVTYPTIAYTTGHEFNRGIWKAFGDSQIEDFWLPFFTNTTNITHSRMDIHTTGYAWRYIRASMSLAGLVPPMTDEGFMLCDGGYVDNLPVGTMKSMGADTVFAVDVGSVDDTTKMAYGDTLSGIWAVANRWNPFSQHPNVPTLAEIQSRLAYSSSVPALERAKRTPGCWRPPISDYQTMEFGKFDEIYQVGYAYAKEFLAKSKSQGKLDQLLGDLGKKMKAGERPIFLPLDRRNSL